MRIEQQPEMHLPSFIHTNVPLADKNWFQTGGAARFFSTPTTPDEFGHAIAFANQMTLPIFILGAGANVLVSDEGFDGLIIQPRLKTVTHRQVDDAVHVTAQAGIAISDLIEYCLDHNLTGLEEFSGIPGTVGGAVYINLHYFSFFIADFLVEAQIVDATTGAVQTVDRSWFAFGYNTSTLHRGTHYLLSATFCLKPVPDQETAYARGRRDEMMRQRASRYPTSHTCGSFFRNFYDHEVTIEDRGRKMVYVAYYLDKIGVKGQLRIGGAHVSYQHANMIVNAGEATSSDIVAVARTMQELVLEQFGVLPQPECRLVGFDEYPLVKVNNDQ